MTALATGLDRLLHPRRIAVIGGASAAEVIRQCDRMGYAGEIWPVHPNKAEIGCHRAYPGLDALPGVPDAAFVGVNRHATIDVVRTLAAMGAGGAVSYASGFREVGAEGEALQTALVEAAGAMPVLGPNCYGFINALDGALLWPDHHGATRVECGVAFVTQSSNIAINLTMNRRGLPIAFMVAVGNQAMVGLAEAIEALAADDRVTAIGLHVEGIADPAALARAVETAHRRGVSVVALKAGRSEMGSRIAMTHTASLAGSHRVTSAFLKRIGIAEVGSIPALIETLKLLHLGGPLPGRRLVSLSCSGGEASLMSDAAEAHGLDLPAYPPEAEAKIRATCNPLVTVSNPFDYHTFDWGNRERLADTFSAVMEAGQDLTVLVLDWPRPELGPAPAWDASAYAIMDAHARTGRRAALIATLPECLPETWGAALVAGGVAPLCGIADGLEAIAAAARLGTSAPRPVATPVARRPGRAVALTEPAAKAELARFGVAVPRSQVVKTREAAIAAAEKIGWPVVAKAVGADLTHKTELGAVILNLRDPGALAAAYDRLAPLGEAVLIEAMVTDAVAELIVGVARDPVIGLHLVVGSGGVLAELVADTSIVLLPAERADVEAAIGALKVAKHIDGWRGKPTGDLAAAVDAVLAIARFAQANADRLDGLDVNPLMVRPAGLGAVAADALVMLVEDTE